MTAKKLLYIIQEQKVEIDRLKNECFCIANERDAYKDVIDTAVTEAIKEFAERLKKPNRWRAEDIYYIDTLVKEMVGEE